MFRKPVPTRFTNLSQFAESPATGINDATSAPTFLRALVAAVHLGKVPCLTLFLSATIPVPVAPIVDKSTFAASPQTGTQLAIPPKPSNINDASSHRSV